MASITYVLQKDSAAKGFVSATQMISHALRRAEVLAKEHKVPVVVEIILERITNIAMGTELDNVNEFEPLSENEEFLLAAGLND